MCFHIHIVEVTFIFALIIVILALEKDKILQNIGFKLFWVVFLLIHPNFTKNHICLKQLSHYMSLCVNWLQPGMICEYYQRNSLYLISSFALW